MFTYNSTIDKATGNLCLHIIVLFTGNLCLHIIVLLIKQLETYVYI